MFKNNRFFLVGNTGVDPVERARSETGPIVEFTLAENVQKLEKDSKKHTTVHTNWFQITTFGNMAE